MSIEAINWALTAETGSPGCKLVLIVLANYANDENEAWPSIKTLTTKTEQGEKTVWRHLKDLEKNGFISSQNRFSKDGSRSSNLYKLNTVTPLVKMTTGQNDHLSFCPENTVTPLVKMTRNPSIKPSYPSEGLEPAKTVTKKLQKNEKTFAEYRAEFDANGQAIIGEDDPIYIAAEKMELPDDYIAIAWNAFVARYVTSDKKYKDWKIVFRKAVSEDWLKLWSINRDGDYFLLPAGKMIEKAMQHGN
jgi:hypothetical protein